ncbi:MAG: heat shock protein GrpE [Actinomycetia bacterium]|nr:heat shock protein GrpE [Actinomycetes bacterium]
MTEDEGPVTVEERVAEEPDPAVALEHQLRAALADLDNLRKRFEREVAREREREGARAAAAWLPVVDDLERALAHAEEDPLAVAEGVRAVHDQALSILARLDFPQYTGVGEPFDPTRHEAVGARPSEEPPGTVVEVVRPGYGAEDHVLRPAAVLVASPADG